MGIKRFDFVGGEVLRFGNRWQEVAAHVRTHSDDFGGNLIVNMLSSGWFLDQTDFKATMHTYQSDTEFLRELRNSGLTHLTFSLDGPERQHDKSRGISGLYRRIMLGVEKVRESGLQPQFSILRKRDLSERVFTEWLLEISRTLYPDVATQNLLQKFNSDQLNYASNFIDVGNGKDLLDSSTKYSDVSMEDIRCKNFFRPSPSLRIRATGEISLCPLVEAGNGYGNIHTENPVELLNSIQDKFAYQLHAENRILNYRPLLDEQIFGLYLEHICSYRVILTMLAQEIQNLGFSHKNVPSKILREINERVARQTGHLPSDRPSLLGLNGNRSVEKNSQLPILQ